MKRVLKYSALAVISLIAILVGWLTFLYQTTDMKCPNLAVNLDEYPVVNDSTFMACNGNILRKNSAGIYEAYVQGAQLERGVALGRLTKELLYYQEKTFINQIKEIIPSDSYLKFLRYFTVIFNRNLGKNVSQEYREEIYGLSLSCSDEFNAIGSAYERQLNFHGAHDIGHTMQEYMLVGCSSFAVWGNKSADSTLIIGRNFDFFVGDDFAKNKIISFVAPKNGYKFASIGWAGMVGVLSGMNETGLTITLNAAKGPIPTSSATPISILAREILQYASTIDEAYKIAQSRHTFVSESLLIGSAKDGKAAIIEKTPSQIALFEAPSNQVICTNHYQSELFKNDEANIENIKTTDSPYRYKRIEELLATNKPMTPTLVAKILRDRMGENGKDIGLTNEKSLNQDIAHHSVIFKPQQRLMWVSTTPWQSGKYICYDLNEIFKNPSFGKEINKEELTIGADSVFIANDYQKVLQYRATVKIIKESIKKERPITNEMITEFIAINPSYYHVYGLLGDYYTHFSQPKEALMNYKLSLTKEIPKENEKKSIEAKIKKLEQ